MRRPAALFPIALALGTIAVVPRVLAEPTAITQCGQVLGGGSYVLANNLETTGPDCLIIETGSVTLDLGGFVISGTTGSGDRNPIRESSANYRGHYDP
jgi:hypothetical protein